MFERVNCYSIVKKRRLKRPRTRISYYYFKKHLGTSWLEGKENISFIGITCFSLNQLKLLSMALELMLRVLAHCAISLENILPIDNFKSMHKGLCWDFLTPMKVTDKVDAPKLINAVAAALCPSISELQGRHSQRQMAPQLPCSPNLNKC